MQKNIIDAQIGQRWMPTSKNYVLEIVKKCTAGDDIIYDCKIVQIINSCCNLILGEVHNWNFKAQLDYFIYLEGQDAPKN
jgi:hypothetical protein